MEYDEIGRLLKVQYPPYADGTASINNQYYQYYAANSSPTNNTGKLKLLEDATGIQKFEYGNMGEITKNTRTVIAPDMPERTFITKYEYDSWGRMQTLTYPDLEEVSYDYDLGGNLLRVSSTGSDQDYIQRIAYDHFEQKVFSNYGNGVTHKYEYTPGLRRLQTYKAETTGYSLFENEYNFDYIGNISSVTYQTNNGALPSGIGGLYNSTYTYDDLNRLSTGIGNFGEVGSNPIESNYNLSMKYNAIGRIIEKNQTHDTDGVAIAANSYVNSYAYNDQVIQPNTLLTLTNLNDNQAETFTYDANGNMTSHIQPSTFQYKNMYWDDNNMMKGIILDDVSLQHYVYDAGGERILKAHGDISEMRVNGRASSLSASLQNYTEYPSGYITVSPSGRYTKHYYSGSERIMSRLSGLATFASNVVHLSGPNTSGLPTRQLSDLAFLYDEGGLGDVQFNNFVPFEVDCGQYTEGSEEQRQCECEQDDLCSDLNYYFHPDHLGSTTFLTDKNGKEYQFAIYLPFGELMVEQKVAQFETPYLFNGKELDRETGLYNYGARYYDPRISLWSGVDPLASKMPGWTPYRYGFNNPILYTDPDGMFEDKAEAKQYAKDHNIKTGWFRNNKIEKQNDGSYAIINRKEHSSISRIYDQKGNDLGVHLGGYIESRKMSNAYTRSVGFAGAFGGGIGFELGYAKDNYGDWGLYFRMSGEFGLGGGAGFGTSELQSSNGNYITLDKMKGDDTEHHAELGPFSWSQGGNVNQRRKGKDAFSRSEGYGDDYISSGGGAEPVPKSWKMNPKLSAGYRVSMGRTWFLYENKAKK